MLFQRVDRCPRLRKRLLIVLQDLPLIILANHVQIMLGKVVAWNIKGHDWLGLHELILIVSSELSQKPVLIAFLQ